MAYLSHDLMMKDFYLTDANTAGEKERSGFICHNSCVSRQNNTLKTKFPPEDLSPLNPYLKKKFLSKKYSFFSRKTRRRPRVKTKFSFMPEGHQREVEKQKEGKKT